MKVFSANYLNLMSYKAEKNPRKRHHQNLHHSYDEPCQRLFNAIEPGSYIRPHRHATDPKDELLIAVRGSMALMTFDDYGKVVKVVLFGAGRNGEDFAAGVELPAGTWHTVIALESCSILLEVKSGPFDPNQPKDLAHWAPDEGSSAAVSYLNQLISLIPDGSKRVC